MIIQFPNQPGMNLERVEERALAYLRQSRNPLVPIANLLEHIQRDESCVNLTERILLDFLRHHEQVAVVDSAPPATEIDPGLFSQVGIPTGPRAILRDRKPTANEMSSVLNQSMQQMLDSLKAALEQAEIEGDEATLKQVRDAIQRTEELQLKMREFF